MRKLKVIENDERYRFSPNVLIFQTRVILAPATRFVHSLGFYLSLFSFLPLSPSIPLVSTFVFIQSTYFSFYPPLNPSVSFPLLFCISTLTFWCPPSHIWSAETNAETKSARATLKVKTCGVFRRVRLASIDTRVMPFRKIASTHDSNRKMRMIVKESMRSYSLNALLMHTGTCITQPNNHKPIYQICFKSCGEGALKLDVVQIPWLWFIMVKDGWCYQGLGNFWMLWFAKHFHLTMDTSYLLSLLGHLLTIACCNGICILIN